jgi:hypothetical protein
MTADPPQQASPEDELQHHLAVQEFCRLVGASSLEGYLGLDAHTTRHEASILLERKRRMLEAGLDNPAHAREAELLLDHYHVLRRALREAPRVAHRTKTATPDYYRILGINRTASFAEVERAFRKRSSADANADGLIGQAWRVLGDPLNRANYDRSRRAPASLEDDLATLPTGAEMVVLEEPIAAAARASIPGPSTVDVLLDGDRPVQRSVEVLVEGTGPWRARVMFDHACLQVHPPDLLELAPGRHALALRFDPTQVRGDRATCSLTLSNSEEQHVVVFRVRRIHQGVLGRAEPFLGAAFAVLLVAVGWALGTHYSVVSSEDPPDSVGTIAQVPTAAICFQETRTALPLWLDVHTDGLGRPTGFSFGGVASPSAEACVKQALLGLDFPPTHDGRPAFHRYHLRLHEDD